MVRPLLEDVIQEGALLEGTLQQVILLEGTFLEGTVLEGTLLEGTLLAEWRTRQCRNGPLGRTFPDATVGIKTFIK